MPGNELGDGVHNFFAQENAPQGQHHSHGNWPLLGNNFLVGGQRQSDVPDSNCKTYNLQNSDLDRGPDSYPFHMVQGLNYLQSNSRPEFDKAQPPNEQANLNGFMYGNQFHQTRQSEARFPTADRDTDQRHLRGLSVHELQQGSPEYRAKAAGGSETSVSFDLFSGQQQINHLPWQALPHQQSGIGDMQQQQLQQQYMIRKMQEVQMQQQQLQQLQQQQNMINQVPHFTKQTSGGQPTLVNSSETLQYPWTAEIGANWMNQGSPAMQGSANGLVSPLNLSQSRQVLDQSLYGVPVSSSRGLNANEYPHMMRDRSSLPQTPVSSHTLQGHQQKLSSVQLGEEGGSSRQKFQNEASVRNMGGHQQVNNFMLQNAPPQQMSAVRTETLPEKPARQVATSQNEIALDPTEEKILFGSDDNIWAAFGSGEACNSYDHAELSNGLPSIPCGSWSALMQSAVAETSSSDAVPQKEWSGLILNNNDSDKPEASFMDNNTRMRPAVTPGSVYPFDINANNARGLNRFRHKSQNEPGQKMQFVPADNRSNQQLNAWNSVLPSGGRVVNNHEKLSENSQSNQLRVIQGQMYRGSSVRKSNSGSGSMELVPGESTGAANTQTNKAILTLNDASSLPVPSNVGVGEETSSFFHNNNAVLNNWKNASVLNQVNEPSQVVDSLNTHDNRDNNENSSDSHHSNLPQHNFVGGFGENGSSNASDSQTPSFGKQKSNNQLTRKASVPRKFQFHPMGNLDENVEPTYDLKQQPNNAQAVPQQNKAQFVESNFFGQASRNSTLMGKGQSTQLQSKNADEQSRRSVAGYAPNVSVPFNRAFDAYASNRASSTSQNMLELLNKVDNSTDQSAMMQFNSPKLPESEKFDGTGRLDRSQSSASQGFGLQLGPPAESQQTTRVSGQMSLHQQIDSPIGNSSCSEHRGLGENVVRNSSATTQEDNLASYAGMRQCLTPNDAHGRVPAMQTANHMQISQNLFVHGGISRQIDSSQKSQTMWNNVPTQLRTSHFQESVQPNIVESSSAFVNTQGYVNSQGSVDGKVLLMLEKNSGQPGAAAIGSDLDPKMKGIKNHSGHSPANSSSTLKHIEAFSRSLKHNISSNQIYSPVNQMQDAETDASIRASKRVKGSDNLFGVHRANSNNEHSVVVGDSAGAGGGVASDGSGMLSFSMPAGILQRNASQPGNMPSQDVSRSNSSIDHNMASITVDHPQVSPQMAPSWFNQYGTFKNRPIHDSPKLTVREQNPNTVNYLEDKAPDTTPLLDDCRVENSHLNSTVATGELSQLNLTSQQHMKTLRPPKKRTANSELNPWHKDIVSKEGSQNCWSISMAERDWSKAANRLIEKDVDGAELIEDKEPMLRSRRRLKLTTQLMQQLFPPAPPAILSADATSDCESVAYAVPRIGMGDACSSLVSLATDLDVSRDDTGVLSAKGKLSGTNGDQSTAKVVEEFIERARKLENDFLRLDKSVSVTDLKVDCQDLEKFAVINRFARFHGRADSAEPTSSADATQKPIPQRYVTAYPVPRSLPDRVQCLSL